MRKKLVLGNKIRILEAPPGHTILLSEILILVLILYHASLWLKKLNGFLLGKHSIFQNNKVKNFKNLQVFRSKRDFSIFFRQ